MKSIRAAILGASIAAVSLFQPTDAEACGGCFVPPAENTQVTGHRMILSVGMVQSTLYDQIEYAGDPSEFAWVLPIKGTVQVGLSSDLVFNQLGFDTTVEVAPPVQDCPWYSCGNDESFGVGTGSSGAGGSGGGGGGVDVLANEVVGPYETVQLASTDPNALNAWLSSHGYNVPADIQPIVAAYVNDGFNFLAMKLVPGTGVDKMQPVRITTPGASPVLPLKMVAAGTGAVTTITLYVIGEGRYEPTNFPALDIAPEMVLWDYNVGDSNYAQLRQSLYDASNGFGWLTEAARPYSSDGFRSQILNVLNFVGPEQSGYDDGTGDFAAAEAAAQADLDVLFAGVSPQSTYVTRLRAELQRPALGADLYLGASMSQGDVSSFIQTKSWVGTQPACPPPPVCGNSPVFGHRSSGANDDDGSVDGSGCALGIDDDDFGLAGVIGGALVVGIAVRRRRRR